MIEDRLTEEMWLTSSDSLTLLDHLREVRHSTTRLPAFVATFVERGRVRALLTDEMRTALDAYLRWVQGDGPDPASLYPAFAQGHWMQGIDSWDVGDAIGALIGYRGCSWSLVYPLAMGEAFNVNHGSPFLRPDAAAAEWLRRQADHLREIVGNPFHPISFAPGWRTGNTIAIARKMYEERDFSSMPILADALQDAGCDNEEILNHCRGPGPHVRGCWVVDLVLGKE
jgi:hypothetical protein